jgi:hypothetical protein
MIDHHSGLGSTMQGLVGGAFEGAGVAIGSLVGGVVYKSQVRTGHFTSSFHRAGHLLLLVPAAYMDVYPSI